MGKKKRRAIQKPVAQTRIPKTFQCPYCQNPASVKITIKGQGSATKRAASVECMECKKSYHTGTLSLIDKPVDIYFKWVNIVQLLKQQGVICPGCGQKSSAIITEFIPNELCTIDCTTCGSIHKDVMPGEAQAAFISRMSRETKRYTRSSRKAEDHYLPDIIDQSGEPSNSMDADDRAAKEKFGSSEDEPTSVDDIH